MALLIYLAVKGDACDAQEIMQVEDIQDEGGLDIMWGLLDTAFDTRPAPPWTSS